MNENKQPKRRWWLEGLIWGAFMFILNVFLLPIVFKEEITIRKLLIGIVIWTIAGMLYTLMIKWLSSKATMTKMMKRMKK